MIYLKYIEFGRELHSRTWVFYDWIYINSLDQHEELKQKILQYNAFTDIAFNSKKSIACQARTAALFVSLETHGLTKMALESITMFSKILSEVYKDLEFDL